MSELREYDRSPTRSYPDLGKPESLAPDSVRGRMALLRSAGLKAWLLAPFLLAGYAMVALMLLIAITKISAPESTGLWMYYVDGVRHFAGGINTGGMRGREVLGYWLVVIPLVIATLLHLGLSGLFRLVTRRTPR
jgi:hypothetical protein